ncbi:MAG: hypothetical protein LKJ80_04855 [Oscillibacter sp.]|nr:hypothetical protein [Oscillibacter sp.]
MTDEELRYFALCGPLEDAIDLLDAGKTQAARALLERLLSEAKRGSGIDIKP